MIGLQLIPGYGRSLADICNSDLYAEGLQRILEVQQALTLVLGQLSDRNAGPAGDNGCNVVLGDSTVRLGLLVSPLLLASLQSLALGFLFVAQLGSILVVLTLDSLLLLRSNGCDLVLKLLEVRGSGQRGQADAGAGLVDDVDRLIRQITAGNVANGQLDSGFDGFVRNLDAVMRFVLVAQTLQNLDGVLSGRLADLYRLDLETLSGLDRMADKSASNLLDELGRSRETTLSRFLYALGIRHVGETTARSLAEHFGNLQDLMNATEEQLLEVDDIGPVVALSIRQFFDDVRNRELIGKLQNDGVHWPERAMKEKPPALPLQDRKFVLTGTLSSLTREAAAEIIRNLGGKVSNSVSKKTDYVLAGSEPGSKLAKAQELGIRILDEEAFVQLVKHDKDY